MYPKRLILIAATGATAAALSLVAAGWFVVQPATPPSTEQLVQKLLDGAQECLDAPRERQPVDGPEGCLSPALQEVAGQHGLVMARQVMDDLATDKRVGGCHFMSHALGHYAVETLPLIEVGDNGSLHCEAGFFDGAVMALQAKHAELGDQEFLELVRAMCVGQGNRPDYVVAACLHGGGHVMAERHPNFREAIASCTTLPDTVTWVRGYSLRASCTAGVVMQFRLTPQKASPEFKQALDLCRGLTGSSEALCVDFTGIADMELFEESPLTYLRHCREQVTGPEATECFARVGQWAFFQDDTDILHRCMSWAANDTDRESCAYGYAEGPYRAGIPWTPTAVVGEDCELFPAFCEAFERVLPALEARFDGSDAPQP